MEGGTRRRSKESHAGALPARVRATHPQKRRLRKMTFEAQVEATCSAVMQLLYMLLVLVGILGLVRVLVSIVLIGQ
jgi:ABC-type uncharacterized transport system involved in gliding motility auxiliary subunit